MARGEQLVGVALLTYAMVRIVFVGALFTGHGVSLVAFAAIEVVTAYPYGVAVSRIVVALANRQYRAVRRPALIAAVCFAAPYAYIGAAGRRAPQTLFVGLILFAVVAAAAGVAGALRRSVALREGGEVVIVDVRNSGQR